MTIGVRVYQRIAPHTGISMPLWLAIPVYALWWFCYLLIMAVVVLVVLVLAGVRLMRAHHAATLLVVVFAAVGLAACGSGATQPAASTTRSAPTIIACLQNHAAGAMVLTDAASMEGIAREAAAGGAVIKWAHNQALIGVERSDTDAQNAIREGELAAQGLHVDLSERLRRISNVVVVYEASPSREEAGLVNRCV